MDIINALEPFDVECCEYGFFIEDSSSSNTFHKLSIPKIMPLVDRVDPRELREVYDNNIFDNDASCRPKTVNMLVTQNYLSTSTFPAHPLGVSVQKGTRCMVHFMHSNINDRRIYDIV